MFRYEYFDLLRWMSAHHCLIWAIIALQRELYSRIFQTLLHPGIHEIIFVSREIRTMQIFTGQRAKMCIVEQRDQSSIANFWTKISEIFRGTVGIFIGMSKCLFIYLTLCRGISNKVLHYHRVPWIQLGKQCYIMLQLKVSYNKTLSKCIVTWNMNEENNSLKYDPVCVIQLLLQEEKCIYENDRLSGFGSLKHMFFRAYVLNFVFVFQLQSQNSALNVPVQIHAAGKHCSGLMYINYISET